MVYGGKEPEEAIVRGPDATRQERRARRRAANATATSATPTRPTNNKSIGTLNFENTKNNYSVDAMPIGDPKTEMADFLTEQHERFVTDFSDYESALVDARNDTSIIDAVPETVANQTQIAEGTAERNRQRYGYQQTGAERTEDERTMQRQTSLI